MTGVVKGERTATRGGLHLPSADTPSLPPGMERPRASHTWSGTLPTRVLGTETKKLQITKPTSPLHTEPDLGIKKINGGRDSMA